MITSSVSWPSRWADASLAATTTKVYFTVHLRLQDCNTWLGIRAAMTGSREQRGFLWWSEGWCGRRVHFTTLCKAAADISGPVRCVAEATVRGVSPSSSGSWSKIMRTFERKKEPAVTSLTTQNRNQLVYFIDLIFQWLLNLLMPHEVSF